MKKDLKPEPGELKGKRLKKHMENAGSARTAALSDMAWTEAHSNLAIPSETAVEQAKEWVDDGSQL